MQAVDLLGVALKVLKVLVERINRHMSKYRLSPRESANKFVRKCLNTALEHTGGP